jgi:uncharacterized protein YcfJ
MKTSHSKITLPLSALIIFTLPLYADEEVGKGAITGGLLGTAIGGIAGGGRGAGIGAAVGLGAGLIGGSIAKSDRKQRERDEARATAAYYNRPATRRYSARDEINALNQEINNLDLENDALAEQIQKMQRTLSIKEQKIVSLDAQVEALQIQNQELREDLRAQRKQQQKDKTELKNANKELQKEILKLKKDLKKKVVVLEDKDDDEDDTYEPAPFVVKKTVLTTIK